MFHCYYTATAGVIVVSSFSNLTIFQNVKLKEMADELTAAKTSAEKYRHQIQVCNYTSGGVNAIA